MLIAIFKQFHKYGNQVQENVCGMKLTHGFGMIH